MGPMGPPARAAAAAESCQLEHRRQAVCTGDSWETLWNPANHEWVPTSSQLLEFDFSVILPWSFLLKLESIYF